MFIIDVKGEMIRCPAVSPHRSEHPERQRRLVHGERIIVRRQSDELFTFTRMGVNVKVGWVPTGHGAIRCHSIAIGLFLADERRLPSKNIAGDMDERKEFNAS